MLPLVVAWAVASPCAAPALTLAVDASCVDAAAVRAEIEARAPVTTEEAAVHVTVTTRDGGSAFDVVVRVEERSELTSERRLTLARSDCDGAARAIAHVVVQQLVESRVDTPADAPTVAPADAPIDARPPPAPATATTLHPPESPGALAVAPAVAIGVGAGLLPLLFEARLRAEARIGAVHGPALLAAAHLVAWQPTRVGAGEGQLIVGAVGVGVQLGFDVAGVLLAPRACFSAGGGAAIGRGFADTRLAAVPWLSATGSVSAAKTVADGLRLRVEPGVELPFVATTLAELDGPGRASMPPLSVFLLLGVELDATVPSASD